MKTKNILTAIATVLVASPAFAESATKAPVFPEWATFGAAIAIGVAALGGALGQSKVAASALESIGRNPGASGAMFLPMILGLALIESLVILAFVVANTLIGLQ